MLSRKVLAPMVMLLLLALAPAQAGDHHREHPMPGVDQGVLVYVRPGQQVKLTISFSAAWENCVQVYEHRTGQMLGVWNNYDGGGGTWVSPKNTTDVVQIYLLVSRHKDSPPNGRKPWHLSPYKILDNTETAVIVGWEDGGDQDYNDAMVVIQVMN